MYSCLIMLAQVYVHCTINLNLLNHLCYNSYVKLNYKTDKHYLKSKSFWITFYVLLCFKIGKSKISAREILDVMFDDMAEPTGTKQSKHPSENPSNQQKMKSLDILQNDP